MSNKHGPGTDRVMSNPNGGWDVRIAQSDSHGHDPRDVKA